MGRKKKDDKKDQRPKAQDPGTLIPGRGADFQKMDPEDLPSLGLPIQPAGGEQFATLQPGSSSDPKPPAPEESKADDGLDTVVNPDLQPKPGSDTVLMGKPTMEAERDTVTVSGVDSSVATPGLRTLSFGAIPDEGSTRLRDHLKTLPGYGGMGEAVANTADLNAILNIRRHNIEGKLSGIVPVVDGEDGTPDFISDPSRPEYDILSELARGGMGIVYTAKQTSLNRRLVIKTLKPQTGTVTEGDSEHAGSKQEDRKLRDMFVSEAVITANLVHPNIVPVHDLGQTEDGKLFYSMKRVDGTPWHHTIASKPIEENIDVLLKVADAVAFAHFNGVINRDLKPENVAIGKFGEVAVLDWGLSVTTPDFKQRDSVVVHNEGFGGSPGYMAPEQVRGVIIEIDTRTDIYLLGAILFQCVTGQAPHQFPEFSGLDSEQAIQRTLYAALNNDIVDTGHSGELINIAKRAMATDPDDRYQTVEQFQDAIREYRITGRAEELLAGAKEREKTHGYGDYQGAVALYDEALRKWPNNNRATEGLTKARTQYAQLAHRKGDFDLGLEVVNNEAEPAFRSIRKKLKAAQSRRRFLKTTVAVTTVAALVGFIAAGFGWRQSLKETERANTLYSDLKDANGALDEVEKKVAGAERLAGEAEEKRIKAEQLADMAEQLADMAQASEEAANKRAAEADTKRQEADTKRVEAETLANMAKTREEAARGKQEAAEAMAQAAEAMAQAADARAERAGALEVAARKAQTAAEFAAWQTRLEAASTSGNYKAAINVIRDMLADKDGDGKADNTLVQKDRKIFSDLMKSMEENVTQLENGVTSATIANDGLSVVVAAAKGQGGAVQAWTLSESGITATTPSANVETPGAPEAIASGRSGLVATKTNEGVRLVIDGQSTEVLPASENATAVRFSADSKKVIIGDDQGTVSVFDVSRLDSPLATKEMEGYRVSDVEWMTNEDGTGYLLLIINGAGSQTRQGRQTLCGAFPFRETDGKLELPTRDSSKDAPEKWISLDLPKGAGLRPLIAKLHLSGDQQLLALSTQDDGTLILLPRRTDGKVSDFPFVTGLAMQKQGREWLWPDRHAGTITHVAFSTDGSRVITAADDATIRVWNVSKNGLSGAFSYRNEGNQLKGHSESIASVGFLGDSNQKIVSTSLDQSIRVWDLTTYQEQRDEILKSQERSARVRNKAIRTSQILRPALKRSERRSVNAQFTMFRPQQRTTTRVKLQQRQTTQIKEHVGEVSSVAFSKDGSRFVTAGQDQTTRVWDSKSGEKSGEDNLFEEGHAYNISSMHFLRDGDFLVTASYDGTLLLWDTKDDEDGLGREVARLTTLGMSNAVAVAPGGDYLVTSAVALGNDVTEIQKYGARMYQIDDLIAGRDMAPAAALFGQHTKRISAIAISPDSSRIVTADRIGEVTVWRADGTPLKNGQGVHEDGVSAMAFISADEIITAGFDGDVHTWRILPDGSLRKQSDIQVNLSYVWRLAVSPDQMQVLTTGFSQKKGEEEFELVVETWDLQESTRTGELFRRKYGRKDSGEAYEHGIAWSPTGTEVVLTVGGELRFYKADDWTEPHLRLRANSDAVTPTAAAYAPGEDNVGVLATAGGRTVHLWNLDDAGDKTEAKHAGTLRSSARVAAAGFSSDSRYIITGSRSIRVYDGENADGDSVLRIEESKNPDDPKKLVHGGVLTWVEFTPEKDSYRFATSGLDKTARIWDWAPGEAATGRYLKHDSVVSQVRWSPDGKSVVTSDRGGSVRIWDANDADKPAVKLPMPDANASYEFACCCFAPDSVDGRWVVAGGRDRTNQTSIAVIWNVAGNQPEVHCVVTGRQHGSQGITAACFTDRGLLVTGGRRGGLIQWAWQDVNPGSTSNARMLFPVVRLDLPQNKRRSTAHRGAVTSIAISGDGTMATSASDGVLLWRP